MVGPNETPVVEARVPGTDTRVSQHPHDDLGTGAQVKTGEGEVKSGDQAKSEGKKKYEDVKSEADRQANELQT